MPPKKKDENKCGECNKQVKEGVQCDICDAWWHPACAEMEADLCESLGKNVQWHWYCIKCNSGIGNLITEVKKMQDRIETIEDCVKSLDDKMEKFKTGLTSQLEKKLLDMNNSLIEKMKASDIKLLIADELRKFDEKVSEHKPKLSEIISKEVENRLTEITGDIGVVQKSVSETKEKIMDNEDKLERRNNIIMYNAEESKSDTAAGRNIEDIKFCGLLMDKVLNVGYEKGEIVKTVRLGKFEDDKKRPLLIEFSNAHVKNVVMENVTKLGSANGEFTGVSISHDMTIKEREQCRELVEEAKKKQNEEQGNFIYRVRGLPGQMKIIKIRKA